MSFPNTAISPALSSSPSKQSIRQPTASRPHSVIDRPATAQQSYPPTSIDDQPSHHHETIAKNEPHIAEEERHHGSQAASQTLFQPFFTLIEDAHTSEYYHPTVHYIFSDDDTEIVTEAALRALDNEQDSFPQFMKGRTKPVRQEDEQRDREDTYDEEGGFSGTRKEFLLPDPVPGVRDNYIILDIDPTSLETAWTGELGSSPDTQGQIPPSLPPHQQQNHNAHQNKQQSDQHVPSSHQFTITSAHSLSPTWQVLNARLVPAPTFDNSSGEKSPNGGLMLQIHGTSGLPMASLGKEKERGGQRLEDMMDQFAKRLDELKLVIENGERGLPSGVSENPDDPTTLDGPSMDNNPDMLSEVETGAQTQTGDDTIEKEQGHLSPRETDQAS